MENPKNQNQQEIGSLGDTRRGVTELASLPELEPPVSALWEMRERLPRRP
jgi:hypothetical protein